MLGPRKSNAGVHLISRIGHLAARIFLFILVCYWVGLTRCFAIANKIARGIRRTGVNLTAYF